jgi:hypothetical protein
MDLFKDWKLLENIVLEALESMAMNQILKLEVFILK